MKLDLHYSFKSKRAVRKEHRYADIEAKMLVCLAKVVHAPEVYEAASKHIVMEYIEPDCEIDEVLAAHEVAKLHTTHENFYGFAYDTTIGPYLQPNAKYDDWVEFYTNERVLYMARSCYDEGRIDERMLALIESVCRRFEEFLPRHPASSLLHGDIWSGNVMCHAREVYFIDPALYYGHNEVELAFIKMFSTFSQRFFDAYSSCIELPEEFYRYRVSIYQIYPYLVHVRSYGSMYTRQLRSILQEVLAY